jgi:Fibrobacter succinogenes major domain (Fib_succ_major).
MLIEDAGGLSEAGLALKSKSGWEDNGNGTDEYSFAALPAGAMNHDGNSTDEGKWV